MTGFAEDPHNGNAPDDPEALLLAPDGSTALLFITVPEPKRGKNRLHLDLVPLDNSRDEEVDRLLAIGATLVDDQRRSDGKSWGVLAVTFSGRWRASDIGGWRRWTSSATAT